MPAITVWTPHHDSVTAAPVASDHAMHVYESSCASRAILHHRAHLSRWHRARVTGGSGHGPADPVLVWRTVPRMASVLVVEDDQFVRSALIRHLTEASHTVRSVGTALEALREVAHFRFDVVILDLGLPDLDGSEALKMLRGITDVPVIIATARDDETEIVRLLNDGADDYLTKPFSVEHLSARMAAVLRRSRGRRRRGAAPRGVLRVGGLTIDPLRRQAELDGARLDLTRREFDLLAFLAGRPGVVVPRKELLAEVWQQSYGDDQTIDVHLSWLRRKLGETAARPRYLHTLRGVGVKLEPPARSRRMRWALVKVCLAVTTMVVVAFAVPLGLVIKEMASDRAFSNAERQAAADRPRRSPSPPTATSWSGPSPPPRPAADGRMAVHVPAVRTGRQHGPGGRHAGGAAPTRTSETVGSWAAPPSPRSPAAPRCSSRPRSAPARSRSSRSTSPRPRSATASPRPGWSSPASASR